MALWSINPPSEGTVVALRTAQHDVPYSYREVGATRVIHGGLVPAGFTYDENRVRLGEGEAVFAAACAALRKWTMFPKPWTKIEPVAGEIRVGAVVTMQAQALGFWWLNACRIVYLIDEASAPGPVVRRYGFAYGTLPSHVESGEERFSVEMQWDGSVWYDLRAFSRPRYWPVKLFKPLARKLQKRFAVESKAAMVRAVAGVIGAQGGADVAKVAGGQA